MVLPLFEETYHANYLTVSLLFVAQTVGYDISKYQSEVNYFLNENAHVAMQSARSPLNLSTISSDSTTPALKKGVSFQHLYSLRSVLSQMPGQSLYLKGAAACFSLVVSASASISQSQQPRAHSER